MVGQYVVLRPLYFRPFHTTSEGVIWVEHRLEKPDLDGWTLTAPVGTILTCQSKDEEGTGWFEFEFADKHYRTMGIEAAEFEGLLFPLDYTLYEAVQVIAQKYEQFKPQRIEMQWLPG